MSFPINHQLRNSIISCLEKRGNPSLITREAILDSVMPNCEHIHRGARGDPVIRDTRKQISRLIITLGYRVHSESDNNRVFIKVKYVNE